ncbi:hypothetical protein HHI36_014875, partial [Cryptolaemus montrouzieri]
MQKAWSCHQTAIRKPYLKISSNQRQPILKTQRITKQHFSIVKDRTSNTTPTGQDTNDDTFAKPETSKKPKHNTQVNLIILKDQLFPTKETIENRKCILSFDQLVRFFEDTYKSSDTLSVARKFTDDVESVISMLTSIYPYIQDKIIKSRCTRVRSLNKQLKAKLDSDNYSSDADINNITPTLNIFALYRSPGSSLLQVEWDAVVNYDAHSPNGLFIGDFNADNVVWNCSHNDNNGVRLLQAVDNCDLFLHNSNTYLRIDFYRNKKSNLDLIFSSSSISDKITTSVLDETWGSNHFPILIN